MSLKEEKEEEDLARYRLAEMLNVDEFEGPWVRRPTDLLGSLSS